MIYLGMGYVLVSPQVVSYFGPVPCFLPLGELPMRLRHFHFFGQLHDYPAKMKSPDLTSPIPCSRFQDREKYNERG